jgi:hypothetical protein
MVLHMIIMLKIPSICQDLKSNGRIQEVLVESGDCPLVGLIEPSPDLSKTIPDN